MLYYTSDQFGYFGLGQDLFELGSNITLGLASKPKFGPTQTTNSSAYPKFGVSMLSFRLARPN